MIPKPMTRFVEAPTLSLRQGRSLQRTFVLATVARLVLVPVIVIGFIKEPLVGSAAIAVFAVADLIDGIVARRLGADDHVRRAADSAIDRVAINAGLIAACIAGALPPVLLAAFLLRDLICGAFAAWLLQSYGVVIKGDIFYRLLTGSFAAWALAAPLIDGPSRTIGAGAVLALSLAVAVDQLLSSRHIRHSQAGAYRGLVTANALRAARRVNLPRTMLSGPGQ